jgi:CTD small phosphatase-like protein 2
LPENFKLQQNNGLFIKTWNDDMRDTQLLDFLKILRDLVVSAVPDVRIVLKKIKDEVNKRIKKNATNPYANIEVQKFL